MPRRVQDIIPSNHRSIRDIPIKATDGRAKSAPERATKKEKELEEKDVEVINIHKEVVPDIQLDTEAYEKEVKATKVSKKKNTSRNKTPWILCILGIIVMCAGTAFVLSGHFATATFNLTPKILPVSINGTYIIPSLGGGMFGYDIVSMSGTASTTVSATQGAYTETKTQGPILVYNSYSTQAQRLVAGTRLSGNSGLIYRLTSTIMVPGYTKSASGIIPGSIATSMTAEKPGQEYNISRADTISDFRVVAYKGSPKYDTFYVRLTGDVSGGFSGTRTVVAPGVLASTTALIQKSLTLTLNQKILAAIPDGYVTYNGLYVVSTTSPVVTPIDAHTAHLSAGVTVSSLIFNKIDLARFLAGASSTGLFGTSGYTTPSIESLSFVFSNQRIFSPVKKTNLVARISGSFNLLGTIPVAALKHDLAGLSLSKTIDILKKYASVIDIPRSSAEISPPWVTTVPRDSSHINVVVKEL